MKNVIKIMVIINLSWSFDVSIILNIPYWGIAYLSWNALLTEKEFWNESYIKQHLNIHIFV